MKEAKLSALRTGRFYPQGRYTWYSYLSEAESTVGPQGGRMD